MASIGGDFDVDSHRWRGYLRWSVDHVVGTVMLKEVLADILVRVI